MIDRLQRIFHVPALCALALTSMPLGARGLVYVHDASLPLFKMGDRFQGIRLLEDGVPTRELALAQAILGKPISLGEAQIAHENFVKTQSYYETHFGRSGYDGKGARVDVAVNASALIPDVIDILGFKSNAFWSSASRFFLFGAGNRRLNNFASSLEIVAHEFTHAVISSTSRLEGGGQPGALNEHLADVFGVLVRQAYEPDRAEPFLIGSEALTPLSRRPGVTGLRDMKDPHKGLVWQPAALNEIPEAYRDGCVPDGANDMCGVHILNGLPNRAAVTIIESLGWEKSRNLFYKVMTERLEPKSNFADYRRALETECAENFEASECAVVSRAFDEVGVVARDSI